MTGTPFLCENQCFLSTIAHIGRSCRFLCKEKVTKIAKIICAVDIHLYYCTVTMQSCGEYF